MTTKVHVDVFDGGLSVLTGSDLSYVICQTEPITRADCTTLLGGGGKRISLVETITAGQIVLDNGTPPVEREVTFPQVEFNSTVQVAVDAGSADLWVAIYDATRLLVASDSPVNRALALSATVTIPELKYGFAQES